MTSQFVRCVGNVVNSELMAIVQPERIENFVQILNLLLLLLLLAFV